MRRPHPNDDRTTRAPVPDLVVDLLRALLVAVDQEGDRPLGQLSDEELGAIDGSDARDADRLVALPRVERLDSSARQAALSAARAGLLARGLVVPAALRADIDAPLDVEHLHGVLGLLVWLRTSPDGIGWVVVETGSTVVQRYLYGVAGVAILEEQVSAEGLHRFTLRSHPDAAEGLVDLVDPEHRAQTDGEPVIHDGSPPPDGWHEVETAVAAADRVTRIEAVVTDDPSSQVALSMASGPDGVLVVGSAPTDERHATPRTAARVASRDTVRTLCREILTIIDPGPARPQEPGVTAGRGPAPGDAGRPPGGR